MYLKKINLKNKTALVTGAGKGIGKACAIALAEAGADLIIISRTQKDLDIVSKIVKKFKSKCVTYACDVTNYNQIKNIISKQKRMIMAALGVGIVYGLTLPFSRTNEAEADQIGLTYMARAGYDPYEAVRFWRRFADFKGSQKVPEFLSTHPTDKTRIRLINRYLTRAKIDYNTLKVRHGLGETIRFKKTKPESPKPIPGISVETLR